MSCLIIKNDGIGDLIMASGLICSVGEIFGGELDLLTCSENHEIAEGIESVRDRFYVSRDSINFSKFAEKFGFLIPSLLPEDQSVLRALASRQYDTVICLRRFIRQSTLVVMRQLRAEKKYCAWQFPTNVSPGIAERSSRGWEHFHGAADVLSELSYNRVFLERVLNTTINSRPSLSFCRMQTSRSTTRRVALGIGGSSTNWPCGNWIELAMRLSAEGWNVVLLGGGNETDLATQIVTKVSNAENHVGQLSWRKTAEVLYDCEGYIGNDTGLSHFASLIVKNSVVILGGGTFRRFFPWPDSENQHVIFHGLNCFDCTWDCKYQDRFCLSLVRPHNVIDYFHDVIEGNAMPECDLNNKNEIYQLSWRRKHNSGAIAVRADLP